MHVLSANKKTSIHGLRQLLLHSLWRNLSRLIHRAALIPLFLCAPLSAAAQTTAAARTLSAPPSAAPSASAQLDPRGWADQCAEKEAQIVLHPNSYLRFRMHAIDEKGDQLRDQIETPEGSVARLIQRDGRALTPEEDSAEIGRLNYLLSNRAAFEHHIRNEQSNRKMGLDLLKLMPQSMLWSYAPGQPPLPDPFATRAAPSGSLIVLDFTPDPRWNPPSFAAEALTGLAGRIWISAATHQMVYIEGSLIKPVNVGWGVVAHLYPGGKISIHQTPATPDRWIVDHVIEQLNVRALMLKTIHQRLAYDTSTYQPLPPVTYQQAIKLLLESPAPSR